MSPETQYKSPSYGTKKKDRKETEAGDNTSLAELTQGTIQHMSQVDLDKY